MTMNWLIKAININRTFRAFSTLDMHQLGRIQWHHLKECPTCKISKLAKFESDMS